MDEQRCDPFQAIENKFAKKKMINDREACQWAWKFEWKWMVISRITWTSREKNDIIRNIPVQNCLYFMFSLSSSSFVLIYITAIWMVAMWFHVSLFCKRFVFFSLHCTISYVLQCTESRVHVLKINAIIQYIAHLVWIHRLECIL